MKLNIRKIIKEEIQKVLETYPFKQNLDIHDYYGEVEGILSDWFIDNGKSIEDANKSAQQLVLNYADYIDKGHKFKDKPEDVALQIMELENN